MIESKQKSAQSSISTQIDRQTQERQKKKALERYDQKLEEMADYIDQTIEEYGPDYFMVEIMELFLDVAIKMKDVMKMLSAMDMITGCLTDSMTFIDQTMNFSNSVMEQSLNTKYGFWSRMREKAKMQRIQQNNIGRMKQTVLTITTKYQMAMDMVETLRGTTTQLKKVTKKIADNNSKKKKKEGKGDPALVDDNSAARKFLEKRRAEKGGAPVSAATATTTTKSSDTDGSWDI